MQSSPFCFHFPFCPLSVLLLTRSLHPKRADMVYQFTPLCTVSTCFYLSADGWITANWKYVLDEYVECSCRLTEKEEKIHECMLFFLFLSEILSREDERRNTHFFYFMFWNVLTKRSCSGALDNVSHKNIRIYAAFKNLFVHIQKKEYDYLNTTRLNLCIL